MSPSHPLQQQRQHRQQWHHWHRRRTASEQSAARLSMTKEVAAEFSRRGGTTARQRSSLVRRAAFPLGRRPLQTTQTSVPDAVVVVGKRSSSGTAHVLYRRLPG